MTAPPTPVAPIPFPAPNVVPPVTPVPTSGSPLDSLTVHVATAATYPWVAAILVALAAFAGALTAQFIQSRREDRQWSRQEIRDKAVRQEERDRDRIAWMREDQQRFAADSRTVYQRFLNAAHELDFQLKRVQPSSAYSDTQVSPAVKAGDALTELVKSRAEIELFATEDIYRTTGEVSSELLNAFGKVVNNSNVEGAMTHLDTARAVRHRLVAEMRLAMYKEITLPGEAIPEAASIHVQRPTAGDRPAS